MRTAKFVLEAERTREMRPQELYYISGEHTRDIIRDIEQHRDAEVEIIMEIYDEDLMNLLDETGTKYGDHILTDDAAHILYDYLDDIANRQEDGNTGSVLYYLIRYGIHTNTIYILRETSNDHRRELEDIRRDLNHYDDERANNSIYVYEEARSYIMEDSEEFQRVRWTDILILVRTFLDLKELDIRRDGPQKELKEDANGNRRAKQKFYIKTEVEFRGKRKNYNFQTEKTFNPSLVSSKEIEKILEEELKKLIV